VQEGLTVRLKPWTGEGLGEEREMTRGWPGERVGAVCG
jgi:hypothetical protein